MSTAPNEMRTYDRRKLYIVFAWSYSVILLEGLIKITVVAVAEHSGDLFNRERGVVYKKHRSFHLFFQKNLGEFTTCFSMEKSRDVIKMIIKMIFIKSPMIMTSLVSFSFRRAYPL